MAQAQVKEQTPTLTDFEVLHGYVVLRRDPPATTTKGGLLLPPSTSPPGPTYEAVVLLAPEEYELDDELRPCPVATGDRVVVAEAYSRAELELAGERCELVPVRSIALRLPAGGAR